MNAYRPYRLEIEGDLVAESPLHVGSGLVWHPATDSPMARVNGSPNQDPSIPGSSLKGVLKSHLLRECGRLGSTDAEVHRLFGSASGDAGGGQGQLTVYEAAVIGVSAEEIRDHVRIDANTGAAAEGAKFDEEVVGTGAKFRFVCAFEGDEEDGDSLRLIQEALRALQNGELRLGAHSGIGYGRVRLASVEFRVFHRDDPAGLGNYLRHRLGVRAALEPNWAPPDPSPSDGVPRLQSTSKSLFIFDLLLPFQGNFLSRASVPPASSAHADAIYFTSQGLPCLRGSSLRGLLRTRAVRICRTMGVPHCHIDDFFGVAKGQEMGKKSSIEVGEGTICDSSGETITSAAQIPTVELDHVAIDRITGFAADTQKFSAIALESPFFRAIIRISLGPRELVSLALWGLLLRDLLEGLRLRAGWATTRGYGELCKARILSAEFDLLDGAGYPPSPAEVRAPNSRPGRTQGRWTQPGFDAFGDYWNVAGKAWRECISKAGEEAS